MGGMAGFHYVTPNHIVKTPMHWKKTHHSSCKTWHPLALAYLPLSHDAALLAKPATTAIEREEVAFLRPPSVHLMNKNLGEAFRLFLKCEGITWEAERLRRDNFCNYLRVDFMSYTVVEWMQCRSCHFGIRNPFTISSKANYSCPSELILPCSASQIFFDKYQHEGLTLAHTKQSTLNIHSDCVKTTSGGDNSTKASISKHIAVIQSYPIPLPQVPNPPNDEARNRLVDDQRNDTYQKNIKVERGISIDLSTDRSAPISDLRT